MFLAGAYTMNFGDYALAGFIIAVYFRLFDFRVQSAFKNDDNSLATMFREYDPEWINIRPLEWRWCAFKAAIVMTPVFGYYAGVRPTILSLLGYLGLCLLLSPASVVGSSLIYLESPRSLWGKIKLFALRWIYTVPREKLNAVALTATVAGVLAILRWVFPFISIKNFIFRVPWPPGLFGPEHLDYITDALMLLALIVLTCKTMISLRRYKKVSNTRFLFHGWACTIIGNFTLSFILSYTALIEPAVYHFWLAAAGAISLRH